MKAILSFNLPEETEEHEIALNGWKYKAKLDEVWEEVFRPSYKHGYGTTHLSEAQAARLNGLKESSVGAEVIDFLAEIYRSVIKEDL